MDENETDMFKRPKTFKSCIEAFPYITLQIDVDVYFTSVILTLKRGSFILYKEILEEDYASDLSLSKRLVKNISNNLKLILQKNDKNMAVAFAYNLLTEISPKFNSYYKEYLKFETESRKD